MILGQLRLPYFKRSTHMIETEKGKFRLRRNLTRKQVRELVVFSRDDQLIGEFTRDPERFGSWEAFCLWKSKGRSIYVFETPDGSLGGLIWFGEEMIPVDIEANSELMKYKTTFAIRVYPGLRGKGLAKEMMAIAFRDFLASAGLIEGIWLEVSSDNEVAIRLYQQFGFIPLTKSKEGKLIMIWDVEMLK